MKFKDINTLLEDFELGDERLKEVILLGNCGSIRRIILE